MIKGNSIQPVGGQSQNWSITMSRLDTVRVRAKQDKKRRFSNLFHHITPELLCKVSCNLSGTLQQEPMVFGGLIIMSI